MHKSFLSFAVEVELKLGKIFEGLHLVLQMFDRKHCQLALDQLSKLLRESDQVLRQMSDHLKLHNAQIKTLPAVVSSQFSVMSARNSNHLTNIYLLSYSLNILTSDDLKPKQTLKDFLNTCFMRIIS